MTELLTGRNDLARAAIVKTVNSGRTQLLRRSIQYFIPVELNINIETSDDTDDSSVPANNNEYQDLSSSSRHTQR